MKINCASSRSTEGRPVARADAGDTAESAVDVPLGDGSCLVVLAKTRISFLNNIPLFATLPLGSH